MWSFHSVQEQLSLPGPPHICHFLWFDTDWTGPFTTSPFTRCDSDRSQGTIWVIHAPSRWVKARPRPGSWMFYVGLHNRGSALWWRTLNVWLQDPVCSQKVKPVLLFLAACWKLFCFSPHLNAPLPRSLSRFIKITLTITSRHVTNLLFCCFQSVLKLLFVFLKHSQMEEVTDGRSQFTNDTLTEKQQEKLLKKTGVCDKSASVPHASKLLRASIFKKVMDLNTREDSWSYLHSNFSTHKHFYTLCSANYTCI